MLGKNQLVFYPGLEGSFALPKQNVKKPVASCFSKASVKSPGLASVKISKKGLQ
jgi:hypothetical protein